VSAGHEHRIADADLDRPLDVTSRHGRWVVLDGLHRLSKAERAGLAAVPVRTVPARAFLLFAVK